MSKYRNRLKKLYGTRSVAYTNIHWLVSQAVPYRSQLLIRLTISTISLTMGFISTIVGKYIVDATTSSTLNWRYIVYMAAASLFSILFSAVSSIFDSYINEKFEFGMRCDMFDKMQRSIWTELSKYHSGDIVTRLTSDISSVTSGLISIIPAIIILAIRLIISFCILLYFDKWIAVFSMIIAPIGAFCTLIYRKKYRYYQTLLRESESAYRSFMQENISNIAVIKAFQMENNNSSFMQQLRNDRMKLVMKSSKLSALMSSVMRIIYSVGYVIAFCWSAYRISKGEITYGTMTVFLSLVSQIQGAVSSAGSIIPQIFRMLISAKRIIDITDIPSEQYVRENSCPEHLSVELHNVTFAYKKEKILDNVTLSINYGDIVGVIGPSGAGKTTLIRLLLSLISPNKGTIEYISEDGYKELAQPASRRFISYVPQGNTLLSGSVESNLRIGKEDASEEELWKALRIADAEMFVRKTEQGLQSLLTEKAGGLSEGQAQRIAIARALIRNKPILILDEATSALDEDTESRILSGISSDYGKTCFIITHRKSMLRYCTRVIEIGENATVTLKELKQPIFTNEEE